MTVKALEVRLNGKKLYTVGMENWRMLGATVSGHRHTREEIEQIQAMSDAPLPALGPEGIEYLNFTAYVGVPSEDPKIPGASSGQNYESHTLANGDEITITVVETDQPDKPLPPHSGGDGDFAIVSSGDAE